jgi:hypothetical protein
MKEIYEGKTNELEIKTIRERDTDLHDLLRQQQPTAVSADLPPLFGYYSMLFQLHNLLPSIDT